MFQSLNILKIIPSSKKNSETFSELENSLNESKTFREKVENDDLLSQSLEHLRKFQSSRLCKTYEDFFNEPDTSEAANFFLKTYMENRVFPFIIKTWILYFPLWKSYSLSLLYELSLNL